MFGSLILKSVKNLQRVHFHLDCHGLKLSQTYSPHQITFSLNFEKYHLVRHLFPVIRVSKGHLVDFLSWAISMLILRGNFIREQQNA